MERKRAVPVVAHRLEPGDVILVNAEGHVHVDPKRATCQRRLTGVRVERDEDKQSVRVHLTDTTGEAWSVWPTDVTWLVLQKANQ